MAIKNMAAVPNAPQGDERYPILGHLLWYGLRDVRIGRQDLQDLLNSAGIGITNMPPEIRPPDAFRRATTSISTRTPTDLGDGKFENIMVRDVFSDSKEIVRHIIREETDSQNKVIHYGKIGQVVYNRTLEKMSVGISPRYEHHKNKIIKVYNELVDNYTGKHIRDMVYKMVHDTNPVNVRPAGGVYFVANTYTATVESLETFVASINQYGVTGTDEAVFESVPMLDIEKQRKLIFDKYESQCSISVEATLGELAHLLKADKAPSPKIKTNYVNKVKELKAGIGKYEELLERDMESSRMKCELLQEQVKQLLNMESAK